MPKTEGTFEERLWSPRPDSYLGRLAAALCRANARWNGLQPQASALRRQASQSITFGGPLTLSQAYFVVFTAHGWLLVAASVSCAAFYRGELTLIAFALVVALLILCGGLFVFALTWTGSDKASREKLRQ